MHFKTEGPLSLTKNSQAAFTTFCILHFSLWWSTTDRFMFVCFMLGPLFGWLIFSSGTGTDNTTLKCWNKNTSSLANFTNICSSPIKCKYSFSFELRHNGLSLAAKECHNKLICTCEKGTFYFRPVGVTRRTEALASVEVSCIFFAYALSRFSSKQPQQEQQKSKWNH